MRTLLGRNLTLHMPRLRLIRRRTDAGAACEFAHNHAVTIALQMRYRVQRTIYTQTYANVIALIFNVNVARAQPIRLLNNKIKQVAARHCIKRLANLRDRVAIALFGNFDILILGGARRVVAQHKRTVAAQANQ